MAVETVAELFVDELSDPYSVKKQIPRAPPKMVRAATDQALAKAFRDHLDQTRGQVERIDPIVEQTGLKRRRIKCAAMEGLVEEGKRLTDEIDKGLMLDVALTGAAQKVEHEEIASYSTLISLAKPCCTDAVPLLQTSLTEEESTDEKLGTLGEAMAIEDVTEAEK